MSVYTGSIEPTGVWTTPTLLTPYEVELLKEQLAAQPGPRADGDTLWFEYPRHRIGPFVFGWRRIDVTFRAFGEGA